MLNKGVIGGVVVDSRAEEPLGSLGRGPIEASGGHVVAERNRHVVGNRNETDAGDEALGGESG